MSQAIEGIMGGWIWPDKESGAQILTVALTKAMNFGLHDSGA